MLARVVSSGSSFLIAIIIARLFGLIGYGDFAKVTAFVSLFYLLIDFGFNAIFLQKDNAYLRFLDLVAIRLFLAFLLFLCITAITYLLPYDALSGIGFSLENKSNILLFSLSLFAQAIIFSTSALFQKYFLYKQVFISTLVGSLCTLLGVLLLTIIHMSLMWILIAFLTGMYVQAFVGLFSARFLYRATKSNKTFMKTLFRETFPVALMLFFNMVYFRIDMFLLSLFRPSTDIALYDASYRVFDFLLTLPLFLSNSLYPHMLKERKNIRNKVKNEKVYYLIFISFGILVAGIFWFLSPLIFYLLRPEFIKAVIPLRILLISLPVFFLTSIMQWMLVAKKQQRFLAQAYAIFMLANIILNLFFIPRYGYIASAIITDVCEAFVALVFLFR